MIENTLRDLVMDTAYHEAAHAVFDYRDGLPVRYVSVDTDGSGARQDICVSARPVEPLAYQCVEFAGGLLAAEWSAYKRRGRDLPVRPFEEFAEEVYDMEEDDWEYQEATGLYPDEVSAMRLLERAARLNEAMLPHTDYSRIPEGEREPFVAADKRMATVEGCYEAACRHGLFCLDVEWTFIQAVAARLFETGYLTGEKVEEIIESVEAEEVA